MLTTHAIDRLPVRLYPDERARLVDTADACAYALLGTGGSAAVRLATLAPDRLVTLDGLANRPADIVIDARQDIIAIVRGGSVATVMLRRHSQPFTPEALRVDRVAG